MIKKIVMMCAAALLACAGAVADDGGVDPGINVPGRWSTSLFVDGARVTSEHLGGTGWSFKHQSYNYTCGDWTKLESEEYKYSTLTISKPGSYTLKGSSEEKRPLRILINADCTVTLEKLNVTAPWMYSAITIKDGCKVKFYLKDKSVLVKDCEHFYNDDKNEYGCHEYCRVPGTWDLAALTLPQKSTLTVDGDSDGELQIDGYVGVGQVGIEKPKRDRGFVVDDYVFVRHAKFGIGGALVVNGGSMDIGCAAWLNACSVYGGNLQIDGSVRSRTCVSNLDEHWLLNLIGEDTSWFDLDLYHDGVDRMIMVHYLTGKSVTDDNWEEALDKILLKEDYISGLRCVNGLLVAPRGSYNGWVCGADEVYVTGAFEGILSDESKLYASQSHLSEVVFGDGARGVIIIGHVSGHMEMWNGADVKVRTLSVNSLTVYGGQIGITKEIEAISARVTGGQIYGLDSNDEMDADCGSMLFGFLQMNGGRIEVKDVKLTGDNMNRMNLEMRGGLIRASLSYINGKFLDGTTVGRHEVLNRLMISGGSHTGTFARAPEGGPVKVSVQGSPAFAPLSKVSVSGLPDGYGAKNIWTDAGCLVHLWLPSREQPYRFTVNGSVYEATVHGMDTTAKLVEAKRYSVTYRTNQGQLYDGVNNRWSQEYLFENLYVYGETPNVYGAEDFQLSCEGKRFVGWEIQSNGYKKVMPGENLPPLTGDVVLLACWDEITAADVNKNPDEGAAPVDPAKTGEKIVTVRFYMGPWEENPHEYVTRDYIAGERYRDLPVVTPPEGYVLDYWQRRTAGGFGGEKINGDSIVRTENHCLYANWKERPATEWTCQFVTKTGLSDDSDWSLFATHDFNIASPVAWMPSETPTRPRHRFVRWETYNNDDCIMEPVTIDTIAAQRPDWVEAVWEKDWSDWTRNRFAFANLASIVDDFPADPALVKSVKGQGLAAGLKLVQDKASKVWCLEGVPTELVDHATRDMFVEVTLKDGAKATLLVKVRVIPEVTVPMRPAFVNENYGMCEYMHKQNEDGSQQSSVAKVTPAEMRHPYVMMGLPGLPDNAKDWKFTGLPTGLKFATKDATAWTDAAGNKQSAPLGSIYGFVKAPYASLVTASHKVTGLNGGSYTETFKFSLEIHNYRTTSDGYWVGGFITDARIDGYVGEKLVYTFPSEHGLANNSKFKFTGLPSGLSYTAVEKKVSGYDKPIPAGSIYGSVTKETLAYAKGTDGSDARPIDVLVSITERPPEVSVDAGAGGLYKISLMKFKPTEAAAISDAGTSLMKGAAYKYRINCDANAKVKVSGLPAGLKLVQNKDKKSADYGKWTLEGAPSKVGEYVAVITVTLNGVSTSITQRYVVQENAYAGDYRGVIASSPAADAAPRAGTIIVNIAEGGATKVTVCEDGKSTLTYSAKSFGYVDSGDYAFVEFELKPSSADAKLGYGVRKGRVTITKPDVEADDYRILQGTVKLEDGTAVGEVEGNFVAPSAANALGSGIDRESRFFTVSDGGFDVPIATVRHEIKSGQKIPTADIAVTLYDGTTAKIAKQPIVRDAAKPGTDEAQRACYSLAPFAVKAKDGQVFVFNGFKFKGYNLLDQLEGAVTFVGADGELVTVDEADADEHSIAAMEFNDYFGNVYKSKTTLMTFDYGLEGFETFALDHVNGGTKRDCLVLDLNGEEIAKIPANNKIGVDGAFSYKFTTKDKIYTYQLDLVYAQDIRYSPIDGTPYVKEFGRLVGMVTKTWKDGKETKTLHGIVDFMTLDPVE